MSLSAPDRKFRAETIGPSRRTTETTGLFRLLGIRKNFMIAHLVGAGLANKVYSDSAFKIRLLDASRDIDPSVPIVRLHRSDRPASNMTH